MLALKTLDVEPNVQAMSTVLASGLGRGSINALFCIATRKSYQARETVVWEGDAGRNLFEVVTGVVKLYKLTPDGRRQVTGFVYPGQMLGLVHRDRHIYTAEAVTDTVLCLYPRAKLEQLADQTPGLARSLLNLANNDLIAAQEQMLLLGRKSATEKIATFLLNLSDDNGQRGEADDRIFLPMTRTDIGDYLGLTTETVSRVMNRLKDVGLIALRQHKYVHLLGVDRLRELAEGDCCAIEY